ncbi:MAG: DNA-protecting protein DprA [Candidatus Latescibacteria bacterium]|nr:DNA-protecting protein DprA [Candidatus Latescibacterota bacterium]
MSDLTSWLLLSAVPGIGSYRFRVLLERFGSPEAALRAPLSALVTVPGLGPQTATAIREYRDRAFADDQLRLADRQGVRLVTCQDDEYPSRLRQVYDPPPLLYVRGRLTEADERAVAIVGTRRATSYGRLIAERLSAALCSHGLTVVSGLARGIDTAAHRGALGGQGRTVAVLGSGLDKPYPPENRSLMDDVARAGAVVSEQPIGTDPDAVNFPQRNRIISGMSLGVIVIEAGQDSGALITAQYALDQDREVFAVPGPITSAASEGTNRLIKRGVAKLIQHVDDVLEELAPQLGLSLPASSAPPAPVQLSLLPDEDRLYQVLSDRPQHIDTLAAATNLPTSQALAVLLALELKGAIRQLPGKVFIRG